jgi:hypothetical protein
MTTFDEAFPSLKGKKVNFDLDAPYTEERILSAVNKLREQINGLIEEFCLDKAKVREAIISEFPLIEDNPDWQQYERNIPEIEWLSNEKTKAIRNELMERLGL